MSMLLYKKTKNKTEKDQLNLRGRWKVEKSYSNSCVLEKILYVAERHGIQSPGN